MIEVDQPLVLGAGVSYKALENLLLAADAEYRAFSGGEVRFRDSIVLVPGAADKEYFTTFDPDWKNVLAIRLGSEYQWHTGNTTFPLVPLRLGFGYAPSPFNPDAANRLIGVKSKSVATTRFTAGFGLHWDQIRLDFAYVHTRIDLENTFQSTVTPLVTESVKSRYNSLDISFTGYF